jgi:hypothetical protein
METTREIYRKKYEAQLKEWGAKVDALKAQADKLTAEAKLELRPQLDRSNKSYEAAKARLQKVTSATDDAWEGMKEDADKAWHDMKASVEGAFDALKKHGKS